ncbi:DUF4230 domain-containing protein [Herbidospora solisilvae]|uniref:DUF4230 domain-containing protein n=1 Tax=Herbidospora solisilvae TaxID=2696284 RepID=UPI002E2CA965|nr:DUF4230 domain-containing protein [Herbidospora solisilvae]
MTGQTRAPLAHPAPVRRGPRRAWRWLAGLLFAALLLVVGGRLAWTWLDPFGEQNIDRSQPALLQSIQNMSRYQAATGNFQVIVDLEKDAAFLPDAVKGTRTLFVGAGTVDAYVEFGGLTGEAITVSEDRKSVTVTLPHAALEKPSLDNSRSYVYAQERGLIDRAQDFLSSNPPDQKELYLLAEKKITEAATASDLRNRADQNTKAAVEGMLKALGFTDITVKFGPQP